MPLTDTALLRELARELLLPPAAVSAALECGVLTAGQSLAEQARLLRQMRRLMLHLGMNASAAALMVRMRREMEALQLELERLRRLEAEYFLAWHEGLWRELDE
jgi:hypothetical protein